jgi:hypothetical protein
MCRFRFLDNGYWTPETVFRLCGALWRRLRVMDGAWFAAFGCGATVFGIRVLVFEPLLVPALEVFFEYVDVAPNRSTGMSASGKYPNSMAMRFISRYV